MLEKRILDGGHRGNTQRVSMGIVEVIPDGGVYDYKRKYSKGSTEYRFPAVLDLEIEEELKVALPITPVSAGILQNRFMICEDGNPYFLEINTLLVSPQPVFCPRVPPVQDMIFNLSAGNC